MSKPHYKSRDSDHRRSPPVSFLGTVLTIIPIPGTCAVKRREHYSPHDLKLSTTVQNRRPRAHGWHIYNINPHCPACQRGSLPNIPQRSDGRRRMTLCATLPEPRVIQGEDPSSIQSLSTLLREKRSNSAHHLLTM